MSKMTIEERLQYVADGRGNFDLAPLVCEHALECIRDLKVIVNCAKTMRKSIKQKRRNSSVKRFDEALENLGGGAREAIGTPAIDAAVKALVEDAVVECESPDHGQGMYRGQRCTLCNRTWTKGFKEDHEYDCPLGVSPPHEMKS